MAFHNISKKETVRKIGGNPSRDDDPQHARWFDQHSAEFRKHINNRWPRRLVSDSLSTFKSGLRVRSLMPVSKTILFRGAGPIVVSLRPCFSVTLSTIFALTCVKSLCGLMEGILLRMRQSIWLLAAALPILTSCGLGRSSASLLPQNIRSVVIHYHPARHRPDQYATIASGPSIQQLVQTFNGLDVVSNGPTTCAADYGQYLNLSFHTAHHQTIQVHDWLACHQLSISTSSNRLFGRGKFSPIVLRLLGHG